MLPMDFRMPEPASVPEVAAPPDPLIRMEHITRRFPGVLANADVHLAVQPGAFHALIGENGAGKSTLLNILYGRYRPDDGQIFLADKDITGTLQSPADAIRLGLGLVSQHYALIPALSVLENIILGAEPVAAGDLLDRRRAIRRIRDLAGRLGLGDLDLGVRAERLSVAAQQKVEILKALYRGARILLLDEPTATLAPQEADSLFALLRALARDGATILFVTHKLREVMTHSDAVTVLRAGRNAGDFVTRETDAQTLLWRMIGASGQAAMDLSDSLSGDAQYKDASSPPLLSGGSENSPTSREEITPPLLRLEHLTVRNARRAVAVRSVSLKVGAGEIVGIAGVDGSGQREMAEAIVGLRRVEDGRIVLEGVDLTRRSVRQRQQRGVAYIPEDRHRAGLILDFTIAENFLLGHELQPEWGGGVVLERRRLRARASDLISHYSVRVGPQEALTPARNLSGGNQQKVVVARAMEGDPRLLVACQPTRGLDVEASRFVYRVLLGAKARGLGVLLFSLDLDEVLHLSDRIAVLFNGQLVGILARNEATPDRIGALMTGAAGSEAAP